MNSSVQTRLATPNEASTIVEIIRQGFPYYLLSCTIYSCTGIAKYVSKQISIHEMADTVFTVACSNEMILGAIELRLFPKLIFLNYIAIQTYVKGTGIGKLLLTDALKGVCHPIQEDMQLDVFEDNLVARAWYERLGFQIQHKRVWWNITLPPPEDPCSLGFISGYPQAEICQNEFDFSQFQLITPIGQYIIGRIHDKWFRLTERSALENPVIFSTLHHIDNQRNILAILPEGYALPKQYIANRITSTFRMTIPLTHLKRNLGLI